MAKKLKNINEMILHLDKRVMSLTQKRLSHFPTWTRQDFIAVQTLLDELRKNNVISKEIFVEDEEN